MRQAGTACGLREKSHHEQEAGIPHRDVRSMVSAIWLGKQELHTAIHFHDLHVQGNAQRIAARLETTRQQHRERHEPRGRDLAQEQQRYLPTPKPYKSLQHVAHVLGETGHRGTRAVRFQDVMVTNNPKMIIEEVVNSFQRQHNAEDGELSNYTKNLISHLSKLCNLTQRRKIHHMPLTLQELNEVLHKLNLEKIPGVDGLPAELYRRLPRNLKRHVTARLWDIAMGRTDMPPDWASLVHPLYKKGNWANSDNWRPIVCATTKAKFIWMLILKRVAPVVYQAIPPTM